MRRVVLIPGLIVLGLCLLSSIQGQTAPPPPVPVLKAVLRVKVDEKLVVHCQFDLPGEKDQSFTNVEYRYAVLDKDGVQIPEALRVQLPFRTIELPKDQRSVTDRTDAVIVTEKLRRGEEYFFVVNVRNLTGLARFKTE